MVEESKNEKEFNFRLITGSLFVLSWLVLIGIKLSSDISLKYPVIISVILTILFIFSIFGRNIYNLKERLSEKEKNPEPITEDEVEEIEKEIVKKMWNYIEKGVPTERKSLTINNNTIYYNKIKLSREIEMNGNKTDQIITLVNATFPKIRPTVLPINCGVEELKDSINKLSKNWYNPDIQETEISTDAFGKPVQSTRITRFSKEEEKREDSVV